MLSLLVGVAQVSLLLRHARSLKDKRHVLQSAVQRLRNQGFSVTECDYADIPKQASVGFAYVGSSAETVHQALDRGIRLFHEGEGEVLSVDQNVFDFADHEEADFEAAEENDPRQP